MEKVLEVRDISKSYGNIIALNNVSMDLEKGEIHGLIGDNGAGKSTLIKIISGALKPDKGEIIVNGEMKNFNSPKDAEKEGISTVHQYKGIVHIRKVYENFFMGSEIYHSYLFGLIKFLKEKEMKEKTREALEEYGFDFDVEKEVNQLSGGQTQIIYLVKELYKNPHVLLLDEPATALSARVKEKFNDFLLQIKNVKKTSILIIGHNMIDICKLSDRITILRRGEKVSTEYAKDIESIKTLEQFMTGCK
jgi:ABC-type sugar transport system ATPase subunit